MSVSLQRWRSLTALLHGMGEGVEGWEPMPAAEEAQEEAAKLCAGRSGGPASRQQGTKCSNVLTEWAPELQDGHTVLGAAGTESNPLPVCMAGWTWLGFPPSIPSMPSSLQRGEGKGQEPVLGSPVELGESPAGPASSWASLGKQGSGRDSAGPLLMDPPLATKPQRDLTEISQGRVVLPSLSEFCEERIKAELTPSVPSATAHAARGARKESNEDF